MSAELELFRLFKGINKKLKRDQFKLKSVGKAFSALPAGDQQAALVKMTEACAQSEDEQLAITYGNCLASLLQTEARPGKKVSTDVPAETRVMIWETLRSVDKTKKAKKSPTVFDVLYAVLYLLGKVWKGPTAIQYQSDAEEAAVFVGGRKSGDLDLAIVVDLLMSLLSRHHKYHKAIVYFVFIELIPQMQVEHLKHILETIAMPDEEMMKSADDDDDEFEPIEGEEGEDEEEMEDEEADDEEEEEEEEEMEVDDDEEDDDSAPVDPNLLASLKNALGDAVDDNEDDDGDEPEDLDDEAMMKMDDMLANAFREHFAKTRKSQKETLEHVRQFRMKCFDLIVLVLSHEKGRSLAPDLIEPFVTLSKDTLKRPNSESVFNRAKDVLEMISNMRKLSLTEKQILNSLERLSEAAAGVTNPAMKDMIAGLSSLLFSASFDASGNPSTAVKKKYEKLLDGYMKGDKVLSELATAPYLKYPKVLVSFVPKILEYAYDNEVKVFKRTEALNCFQVFLRKDLICSKEEDIKKVFAKVAKLIGPKFTALIRECSKEEIKPRLFAFALKTFLTFAKNVPDEFLGEFLPCAPALQKFMKLKDVEQRLKKSHKAVMAVCGKKPMTVLQQIHQLVDIEEVEE